MDYTKCGEITKYELQKTFEIRKCLKLVDWVVMPNHVHVLFSVRDCQVETPGLASLQSQNYIVNNDNRQIWSNSKIRDVLPNENYNKETPDLASLQGDSKQISVISSHKNHPMFFNNMGIKSKKMFRQ